MAKNFQDFKNKTILLVSSHPDDMDFGCFGSAAIWIKNGATVFHLILTDGSKGHIDPKINSKDIIKIRRSEELESSKIIGIKEVFFLNFIDGELENTHQLKIEIVKVIRKIKPNIVVCFDPLILYDPNLGFINHPDHRAGSQATVDAVFPYSRNIRSYPELLKLGLYIHNVEELYLVNFSNANFFVDIGDTLNLKQKALAAHISQGNNLKPTQDFIKTLAIKVGKIKKIKYAESFIKIKIEG